MGMSPGLKGRRRVAGAEIAAGQLHGRRRPADIHERRQILVRGAQRIGDPTAQTGVFELPQRLAGGSFQHCRKVVRLMAVHGAHHGDVVDHFTDVREPVRDRNARFSVVLVRAQNRNHGPLHGRVVVAEADGIHDLAGVLVVLGIERIDVAHAAAHEEEDDGLGVRRARQAGVLHQLALLREKRTERGAQESGGGLEQKAAPRDPAAGI